MRILFVHNRYLQSAGGEDTTVNAEVDLLLSKGHAVKVLYFDNTAQTGISSKIKSGLGAVYNRSSALRLKEEIRQFAPDVIHVHNFFFTASPAVIIAAHKQQIPLVVTIQNYRLICANALLLRNNSVCELCVHHTFPWYGVKYKCYHESAVESAVVGLMGSVHKMAGTWKKKVDTYIVPARFMKWRLENSSLRLDTGLIKVKRNFIDDPGAGRFEQRDNFFLFVGRLAAEKGIAVLLNAFRALPDTHIVIAGDGPDKEALVREFGGLPNVRFVGKKTKEEVIGLMKSCRALIFPSIWYEGLPLTIIEALATGTPVIASRLGAMEEMISDEENGILFEPGNPGKLEQAIIKYNQYIAQGNYSLYEAARQSYLEQFHPDKCYEEVINIYKHVIASRQLKKNGIYG